MDEAILRERLDEIAKAMAVTPPSDEPRASRGSYIPNISSSPSHSIDQLLDYLRLRGKYLSFDLEATRRENRYLRQMLERRHNLGSEPPEGT